MKHALGWLGGSGGLILLSALSFGLNGQAADYYVNMEDHGFFSWRFNPSYLEIQVGDTVTWINADYTQYSYLYGHDATCYAGTQIWWSTGSIEPGSQSNPITFPFAATFSYEDHTFYSQGMTATLVVQEATPQLPVPATLLDPQLLPDGNFQCLVSNLVVGTTYIMQASTNLVDWTSISTNIASSSVETFTDPDAAASGIRFYRSWHQP
jgi:plastocyanin